MSTSWGAVHRWAKPLPLPSFRPSSRFLPTIQSPSDAVSYSKWALKSVADADPVVVAADGNYGSKQVISVTPRLYDYLLANVREPQILRELREETATMRGSQMQVIIMVEFKFSFLILFFYCFCPVFGFLPIYWPMTGEFLIFLLEELAKLVSLSRLYSVSPDQAQLLAMLVQILGAERCIEVGVYTGYSSLAIALVLPEGGHLVACERDARSLEVAKRYYDCAGVSHKVDVKHGLAADTLKSMIHDGESCSYDFAFVDAEKRMYSDYFELLLQLVRVGGIIVIDNVLWHGKVADPLVNDPKTVSIRDFNKKLMDDERVSISMVPVGDGMTICRKR